MSDNSSDSGTVAGFMADPEAIVDAITSGAAVPAVPEAAPVGLSDVVDVFGAPAAAMPPLFAQTNVRKPEYWQFAKLIAPAAQLPENKKAWTTDDAVGIWCLRCAKALHHQKGSSQSIRYHMETKHEEELQQFRERLQRAKVGMDPSSTVAARILCFCINQEEWLCVYVCRKDAVVVTMTLKLRPSCRAEASSARTIPRLDRAARSKLQSKRRRAGPRTWSAAEASGETRTGMTCIWSTGCHSPFRCCASWCWRCLLAITSACWTCARAVDEPPPRC